MLKVCHHTAGHVPLVHLEGGALAELGGALGALEGLGPRVRPLVQRQRRLGAQRLAALWTYVPLSASLVNLAKTVRRDYKYIYICIYVYIYIYIYRSIEIVVYRSISLGLCRSI